MVNNGPGKSSCIFRDYANNTLGDEKSKLARKRFHIGTGRILTGAGQVIAFHKQGLGNGTKPAILLQELLPMRLSQRQKVKILHSLTF